MKASDLKALLLLSFAPSSLSLNSFFSSEHSSSGLAERGARLRSIRKLPSLPVVVSVVPFSLSPYLCYGPLKCIRGPAFIVLAIIQDAEQHHNRHAGDADGMPGCPLATLSIANNDASRN